MKHTKPGSVPGSVFVTASKPGKHTAKRTWIDEKGTQQTKTFVRNSEQDAWDALGQFHTEWLRGDHAIKSPIRIEQTFGQWTETALETIFKPKLRASTYALYEGFHRNHFKPIRNILLSKIDVDDLEPLWNGKKLARNTKVALRRFAINLLNHAHRKGYVESNVGLKTILNDPQPKRKTVRALTEDQVRSLLGEVWTEQMKVLFLLQVTSGLRIGEAVAIRWEDLEGEVLHIRYQVQRDRVNKVDGKTTLRLQDLKTQRSHRTVAVDPSVLQRIHKLPKTGEFIFGTKSGHMLDPRNAQRALEQAAKRAGLEGVSTHVLRHTFATLMVKDGLGTFDLRDALGHTDLRTTAIYAEGSVERVKEVQGKVAKRLAC